MDEMKQELEKLQKEKDSLLAKRDELLEKNQAHKQFAEQVNSLGGLEAITELVESTKQKQAEQVDASNDIEAVKKHYAELLENAQTQNSKLTNQYITEKTHAQLISAINEKGGNSKLLEPLLSKRVKGQMGDDGITIQVLDQFNSPMLVDGREATIQDLVNEFAQDQDYKAAFTPAPKSGTGSMPGTGQQAETFTVAVGETGNLEKLSELYKKNPTRAREIMKNAGMGSE